MPTTKKQRLSKLVSTPTVHPSSHWQTYTDNKHLFSLKYPADWTVEIVSPTEMVTDPQSDQQTYFGITRFNGPQEYLLIKYGDGFGGGDCLSFGGTLEPFTAKPVNQV